MKIIRHKAFILILALCLAAVGCASRGGDDYSNQQERQAMTVKYGPSPVMR